MGKHFFIFILFADVPLNLDLVLVKVIADQT